MYTLAHKRCGMRFPVSATTMAFTTRAIPESRVAVIGGSIAGCAAAIALKRAGVQQVDVFERSSANDLADRGLGIGLPSPIFQQLVEQDILDADMRYVETEKRYWYLKNDSVTGKKCYENPMKVQLHNWGLLWNQLRKRVEDPSYHSGVTVDMAQSKIHQGSPASVELFSDQQSLGEYDFCIQAEGALAAGLEENKAKYAGYVLWRGSFPVKDHPQILDLTDMPETFFTSVYENGHSIFYLMPTVSLEKDGEYLLNYAIYTRTPPALEGKYLYKATRAGQITPEQLGFLDKTALSQMPARFKDMVSISIQEGGISIHPILDRIPKSFSTLDGLGLLLGDAGAVLRPHTASGTTKAIMEALLLQKLIQEPNATWQSVSEAYQTDRDDDAKVKVALGERLGRAQVLETPDWQNMEAADFDEWLAAQVAGSGNYMYKGLKTHQK